MQVMPKFLTLLLWAPSCLAQIGPPGHHAAPGPPGISSAPAPPTNVLPPAPTSPAHCDPGDLLPGPTCTSFYMCVGSIKYATRRVKFECAPGTVFDGHLGICIFASGSNCISPQPPPLKPGPTTPPTPVGPTNTNSCTHYQLDPTTVFECLEEGVFPFLSDCAQFYKCVVTMGCTIKGFLFSCPAGYIFDNRLKKCESESLTGPCDRLLDDVGHTHEIWPVVEIRPDKIDDFFNADVYWDLMPFLPDEPQRLVPVAPASFARAPDDRVFNPFA